MSKKRNTQSRREFIRVTAATGIASTAIGSLAEPASAAPQETPATSAENALPKNESVRMFEGTAAAAVVEQLRATGTKMMFHTNTSGFAPLWDAVYQSRDMQVIMVTHEGQGVAAAAGYAMASKHLGFFVASGVGIPNSMSNLYCAWKDRAPVIATFSHGSLNGQGKDETESWDGNLKPTESFTRWTGSFLTDSMTDVLRRAIKYAYGPPSGPVTLDWGNARQAQRVKLPIYDIDLANARARFRAKPDLIQKAAQWLAEAQSPLFMVGHEIEEEDAAADLLALAEKLAVPVVSLSWPNQCYAFPTDHALFLGEYERTSRFPRNVDLVVNFGARFAEEAPDGAATVHISHEPEMLGKVFSTDLPIASELKFAIKDISDALDSMYTKDRLNRIRSARMEEVSTFTSKLKQARDMAVRGRFDQSPLSSERVGYELEKALDKNAVIVPENQGAGQKVVHQMKFGVGNKLKIGRTIGSALGWGVAAAFGVNLAMPDRQVVALQGDGGILFGQTETFWSISRYEAPMLIVVLNNHVYNETRARAIAEDGALVRDGREMTGHLGDPYVDFTKIAEAYGLKGEKVRTPNELAPAIQRSLRTMRDGKAVVLDIEMAPDLQELKESTWYQRYSVAKIRNERRSG